MKPKRTIRFMLWSGEEQGLLGSPAYVKAHTELMPKISAVLVHDGGTNYLSGIGATEAMRSDFEQVFAPVRRASTPRTAVRRSARSPACLGGGSDHASFLSANVPGFFWGQSGRRATIAPTTPSTTRSTRRSPNIRSTRRSWSRSARYGIANLDHLLSRERMRPTGAMAGGQPPDARRAARRDDAGGGPGEGGAAEKAGVKVGDKLVKFNNQQIDDTAGLSQTLQKAPKDSKLVVQRDGKDVEIPVTIPD